MDWFTVDKEGLARLMERKGKTRVVFEAFQNSWDEDGVTRVTITLAPHERRGRSLLVVEDDAPDGFADLTHAFTLFAPSKKVTDAAKRGRWNLGEKLLLSLADSATVISTRGGYEFTSDGRRPLRRKRETGTEFRAVLRLTAVEREEVAALVRILLPPPGIVTVFNGETLTPRRPVREFTASLRTDIADADGILRPTRRTTTVRLFDPRDGETPTIYEMGIPVVPTDMRWHVDIAQKVPLSFERDNVTPGYLRDLRVAVLNATADLLGTDDVTETWVKDAAGDDRADVTAIRAVHAQRFGDKAVAYDPSDPEANAEAVLRGYTVVSGGSLSKREWAQVRRAEVLRPAGQVLPTRTARFSPDGKPPIPETQWTPGMARVAGYAKALAHELLGATIDVDVYALTQPFAAAYGDRHLTFNLMRLGHRWFNEPDQGAVDALLIHEFAHHRVGNHLSEDFHRECCRLGAALRNVSLRL